jgi:hypothetical protein
MGVLPYVHACVRDTRGPERPDTVRNQLTCEHFLDAASVSLAHSSIVRAAVRGTGARAPPPASTGSPSVASTYLRYLDKICPMTDIICRFDRSSLAALAVALAVCLPVQAQTFDQARRAGAAGRLDRWRGS